MSNPNNMARKMEKGDLAVLANNFLRAIAKSIEADVRHPQRCKQKSTWMMCEGSRSHSQSFERVILFSDFIFDNYRKKKRESIILDEERDLINALEKTGISKAFEMSDLPSGMSPIPQERTISDLCSQLVLSWLKLENPFSFEEPIISNLIVEFLDAVVDGKTVLRQRIAIEGLNALSLPIIIHDGIIIRQISEEELWEIGDINNIEKNMIYIRQRYPKDNWKIIDIKLSIDGNKNYSINDKENPAIKRYNLVDTLLVLLRLGSSGSLKLFDLGSKVNYGFSGTLRSHKFPIKIISSCGSNSLDTTGIERLQNYWPQIFNIIESNNHYLRISATRLLDGGLRQRHDDAILDYAIGLESLLTGGAKNELSYRFALRGATILSWDGGNKKIFFGDLKELYDIRSSIVHGVQVKRDKQIAAYINGEKYLREIFWWYLINDFVDAKKGLKEGTDRIDARILNS